MVPHPLPLSKCVSEARVLREEGRGGSAQSSQGQPRVVAGWLSHWRRYCRQRAQDKYPDIQSRSPLLPAPSPLLPPRSDRQCKARAGRGRWQAPTPPGRAGLSLQPCSGRGRLTPPQTTGLHVTRALAWPCAPAQPDYIALQAPSGKKAPVVTLSRRPQLPAECLVGRGTVVVLLVVGEGVKVVVRMRMGVLLFSPAPPPLTHPSPPPPILGGGHN